MTVFSAVVRKCCGPQHTGNAGSFHGSPLDARFGDVDCIYDRFNNGDATTSIGNIFS